MKLMLITFIFFISVAFTTCTLSETQRVCGVECNQCDLKTRDCKSCITGYSLYIGKCYGNYQK